MYLNAGYPRIFIYSVLNASDASVPHIRTKIRIIKLEPKLYKDYKVRQRQITKCNRFRVYKAGLQITIGFGLQSVAKILKNGLQSAMVLQSATDCKVIPY